MQIRGVFSRTLSAAIVLSVLLFSQHVWAAQALFVADGYYQQEVDIYNRLENNGYDVTVKKSYKIKGTTDLSPYDLIIVTEYAPGIGYSGINNIDGSGKPLFIISYWDFYYAYQFDMSWDSWGDWLGTDTVHNPDADHFITEQFGDTLEIHDVPWATLDDLHVSALKSGVTPLIYSDQNLQNVTVAVDDVKKRVVSGICDTTHYTAAGWELFDRILCFLTENCGVTVEDAWSNEPDDDDTFVQISETTSGELLAMTHSDVYSIDTNGVSTERYTGDRSMIFVLNAGGNNFGVYSRGEFSLRDNNGDLIDTQPVSSAAFFAPIPNSDDLFSPISQPHHQEYDEIVYGRIVDASGAVQYAFPIDDFDLVKVTSDFIYYSTYDHEIVKLNHQGTELWRLSQPILNMKVSSSGGRIIARSRSAKNTVLHYLEDTLISTTDVTYKASRLAISPSGEFSAAGTQYSDYNTADFQPYLHTFENGEQKRILDLPMKYVVSVDVSDLGEIIVGGQDFEYNPRVMLFNHFGVLLWENEYAIVDNIAGRPGVRFMNQGEAFIVNTKDGVFYYDIERSI